MLKRLRLLLGISIFWVPLSMLTDGFTTLVLPVQVSSLTGRQDQATTLGILTFVGLLGAALIQPLAGAASDRLRPSLARRGFIGIGLLFSLFALLAFVTFRNMTGMIASYLAIQLSASFAQAGQQGLIPDLVEARQRGLASGLKGFMDIGGAMLGFVVLGQFLGSGKLTWAVGAVAVILISAFAIASLLTREDRSAERSTEPPTRSQNNVFALGMRHNNEFARLLVSRFLFLLGIYAIGRFLLFFISERLGLTPEEAASQAGNILAALTLITVLTSPLTGWLSDRIGRRPLILAGALLGAASAILLSSAHTASQILIFGSFMSLASAAFSGGSWALLADLAPKETSARYFGVANISTAGAAAAAGLLGPLLDFWKGSFGVSGYTILFSVAALAFLASLLPLWSGLLNAQIEVKHVGENYPDQRKESTDASRLAGISISTLPASPEEDPHPESGTAPS